ncbi:Hypothetical protein NTJ_10835 [Nesidiocoris tenuis]|uniref:Secreted protein n=1 Tax=Nesidiocoris tenuis TaxID=355587 RepID=A0ABN7B0T9_9HEMI|nr:Hypothetical protein NTJ_10835 [Nesidiocoris tenuis]
MLIAISGAVGLPAPPLSQCRESRTKEKRGTLNPVDPPRVRCLRHLRFFWSELWKLQEIHPSAVAAPFCRYLLWLPP